MKRDQLISAFLQADIPILLWGAPGNGKTSWITSLAESMGAYLEVIIASIHDPTDFVGLQYPDPNGTETRFLTPAWVNRVNSHPLSIVFYDEISTAPQAVQAALLRTIQERVVGETKLHSGVRIIAAANPPELAAGGFDLSAPLANRFAHFDWLKLYSPGEWLDGFLSGGWPAARLDTPCKDLEAARIEARAMIGAFLTARPSHIEASLKEMMEHPLAFPTRRSWDRASQALAFLVAYGVRWDTDIMLDALAAMVGEGHALEAIQYMRELDLPDPAEMLANPHKCKLPERSDRVFAAMSAAIGHVLGAMNGAASSKDFKPVASIWIAALDLLERLNGAGHRDIAMSLARLLLKSEHTGAMLGVAGGVPPQIKSFRPILDALKGVC